MFSSVISCLSWTNLEGRHWVGPAFWYASIGLAITSVVLAAQQMLVIDTLQINNAAAIRKRLVYQDASGEEKPRRIMLHVWQVPTECLSYSISSFLVGLMSHIYSPVAMKMAWDSDAKVRLPLSSSLSFELTDSQDCNCVQCHYLVHSFTFCVVLYVDSSCS
jgi:hypothetical protein